MLPALKKRSFEILFVCEKCSQIAIILKIFFSDDGDLTMLGVCAKCGSQINFCNNVVQWMYGELDARPGRR